MSLKLDGSKQQGMTWVGGLALVIERMEAVHV